MFSDNLLFPTDLLDRHYNVKLPDMKKALSMLESQMQILATLLARW